MHGCARTCTDTTKFARTPVNLHGFCTDLHGSAQTCTDLHGSARIFQKLHGLCTDRRKIARTCTNAVKSTARIQEAVLTTEIAVNLMININLILIDEQYCRLRRNAMRSKISK